MEQEKKLREFWEKKFKPQKMVSSIPFPINGGNLLITLSPWRLPARSPVLRDEGRGEAQPESRALHGIEGARV